MKVYVVAYSYYQEFLQQEIDVFSTEEAALKKMLDHFKASHLYFGENVEVDAKVYVEGEDLPYDYMTDLETKCYNGQKMLTRFSVVDGEAAYIMEKELDAV